MSCYNCDWDWSVGVCCHNALGLSVLHTPLCIGTTNPSRTGLNPRKGLTPCTAEARTGCIQHLSIHTKKRHDNWNRFAENSLRWPRSSRYLQSWWKSRSMGMFASRFLPIRHFFLRYRKIQFDLENSRSRSWPKSKQTHRNKQTCRHRKQQYTMTKTGLG